MIETTIIKDGSDLTRWDSFVKTSLQACPFATSTWFKALRQSLDIQTDLIAAFKGDEIIGGAAVFYRSGLRQKKAFVPPLTPYTSYLYRPIESTYPSKIAAEYLSITHSIISRLKAEYSGICHWLLPSIYDVRPWTWEKWSAVPRYTYILDIKQDLNLSHAIRKQVGKGERNSTKLITDWDLDKFWEIYIKTRIRQKFDIGLDQKQFHRMSTILNESGLTFMASAVSSEEKTISSRIEVFLPGTDTVYDWVAASDPEYLSSGATPWLMVQIARSANQLGFTLWDLCGADFENIARFKSEFGGQLIPYYVVREPLTPLKKIMQLFKRPLKSNG